MKNLFWREVIPFKLTPLKMKPTLIAIATVLKKPNS